MQLILQTRDKWIPDLLGNDKLPAGQQVEIDYRKPPAYARNNWQHQIARRTPNGKIETFVDTDVKETILASDVKIRNLKVSVDGGEPIEITTGEQLVEIQSDVCWALATKLAEVIIKPRISRELLKNSVSDSGPAS